MMAITRVDLIAHMEDGRALRVAADQRDFAKWEVQPEARMEAFTTRLRFLAWSAAYRQQFYKGSFAEFNEVDCVEIEAPNDATEESDGLDPGQSAASADR